MVRAYALNINSQQQQRKTQTKNMNVLIKPWRTLDFELKVYKGLFLSSSMFHIDKKREKSCVDNWRAPIAQS